MSITNEQTRKMAKVVVDTGVMAAQYCKQAGLDEGETVELLASMITDEDTDRATVDAMMELLGVALIKLAAQAPPVDENAALVDILKRAGEAGLPLE